MRSQRKGKASPHTPKQSLYVLAFAALGIVYGDIGTSPLYAINEIFFGNSGLFVSPENVLGAISLVEIGRAHV